MSIIQDSVLIARLKLREEKAFEDLYLAYYSQLIGFSRKFNFSLMDPEDFAHETFIRLYNKAHLLQQDVALDKQVFVICRNIILNQIRKEKKKDVFSPADFIFEFASEEYNHQEIEEQFEALNRLIEQLPEKRKQIFVLHKIDKLSYNEIAEKTGLSKKTIANHIYLAAGYVYDEMKKHKFSLGTFCVVSVLLINAIVKRG